MALPFRNKEHLRQFVTQREFVSVGEDRSMICFSLPYGTYSQLSMSVTLSNLFRMLSKTQ